MKTEQNILNFLFKNGNATIDEMSQKLKISRQYIHKVVKELIDTNKIIKTGKAPHVYYKMFEKNKINNLEVLRYDTEQFLNQHFILVDALGNKLEGINAMKYWCSNQNLPFQKTTLEYVETRKKYLSHFSNTHFIDGLQKLANTNGIGKIGVDDLFYLDFYAIERFGKTRLGCLMHYAKQGQNKNLMKQIVNEITNRINNFILTQNIDAIIFVPPTINRKIQIMTFLEKELKIELPKIIVKKISNEIIIPQKALSKLFERVANAKHTFIVPNQKKYNKVLIIDDAIGSGATINEIALKIKDKKLATHIIGMAITGSYKGFEVISEI